MTDIAITKIKRNKQAIEIHAELELAKGRGVDARILRCSDEPLPSFTKAMDALEPIAREILELMPEQWSGVFTVTGVSISRGEYGEGVVITSSVALSECQAPLVLNTPHIDIDVLGNGARQALDKVRLEAKGYLDGKRKGDLFREAA